MRVHPDKPQARSQSWIGSWHPYRCTEHQFEPCKHSSHPHVWGMSYGTDHFDYRNSQRTYCHHPVHALNVHGQIVMAPPIPHRLSHHCHCHCPLPHPEYLHSWLQHHHHHHHHHSPLQQHVKLSQHQ